MTLDSLDARLARLDGPLVHVQDPISCQPLTGSRFCSSRHTLTPTHGPSSESSQAAYDVPVPALVLDSRSTTHTTCTYIVRVCIHTLSYHPSVLFLVHLAPSLPSKRLLSTTWPSPFPTSPLPPNTTDTSYLPKAPQPRSHPRLDRSSSLPPNRPPVQAPDPLLLPPSGNYWAFVLIHRQSRHAARTPARPSASSVPFLPPSTFLPLFFLL